MCVFYTHTQQYEIRRRSLARTRFVRYGLKPHVLMCNTNKSSRSLQRRPVSDSPEVERHGEIRWFRYK